MRAQHLTPWRTLLGMTLRAPVRPDALRPTAAVALQTWAARVRADREQVERCREIQDPSDFYAPVAGRFRMDPRRTGDPTLELLRDLAQEGESWLDIGAGGGRFALPLALKVSKVVCVEPSEAMVEVLHHGMAEHGISNISVVGDHWPPDDPSSAPTADVTLMAHIGYDIEAIGPFLDAAETAARRLCIVVLGEGAMTTVATLFWERIHGEPRVALPALPELMALLVARGILPEVRLVERAPPTFDSMDDLLAMGRRQLWVRPDSAKDRLLSQLIKGAAIQREGGWTVDRAPSRIGVASWVPR